MVCPMPTIACILMHEMLAAKTHKHRRIPKLPPNSGSPWPRRQQVAHTKETCISLAIKKLETSFTDGVPDDQCPDFMHRHDVNALAYCGVCNLCVG